MSKFRARQLDASKPIPIYFQEDISDSTEFNNVTNRTVPQLPTGMEKEEETEHHLQQAIFHHRVIPVPEVYSTENDDSAITYNQLYPPTYKATRQMIHIHPFSADQDIPDYDMDSEDEEWLENHTKRGETLPLDPNQFEEMMDRLEKASGLKAVTLQEAKCLLKDDDDLITSVFDYWLSKRLRLQHPLIPQCHFQVKTEKGVGSAPTDPYVAFRKRTEKMQTRKNRKNDETSYEKMLKLRRDLVRAVTLLEMVKRREKAKRELLHLNIELHEKRYEMEDFSGAIINEVTAQRMNQQQQQHIHHRPAFTPLTPNHKLGSVEADVVAGLGSGAGTGSNLWLKVPALSRSNKEEGKRERRTYKKKRKHIQVPPTSTGPSVPTVPRAYTHPPDPYTIASVYPQTGLSSAAPSEEEILSHSEAEDDINLDGYFAFRRKPHVNYHAPREFCDSRMGDISSHPKYQYYHTSVSHPMERVIGLARRRVGRGGRVWLDRIRNPLQDLKVKSEIKDEGPNGIKATDIVNDMKMEWPHFQPSVPTSCPDASEDSEDAEVDVETVSGVPSSPCVGGETLHPPPHQYHHHHHHHHHHHNNNSNTNTSSFLEDSGGGGKDPPSGGLPSSFYITAEVVDGSQEGSLTDLHVSLPPLEDLDILSVVEDNSNSQEIDVLSTGGKVSASTHSHSETVTNSCSNNNNNNSNNNNNNVSDSDATSDCDYNKGGIHSSTKWTFTNCGDKGVNSSSISLNSSGSNNSSSHHIHSSSLDFQTQPSSRFFFSDTNIHPITYNNNYSGTSSRQQSSTSHIVTGDESLKLGLSSFSSSSNSTLLQQEVTSTTSLSSSSTSSTTYSSSSSSLTLCTSSSTLNVSHSLNSSYVSTLSEVASTSSSCLLSSSSSSVTSSSSLAFSLTSFLNSLSSPSCVISSSPKALTVSSSIATSLSNSLFCASPNLTSTVTTSSTKTKDDISLLEQNSSSKKLPNISSVYFRSSKERLQIDHPLPSGLLLSSNKTNGNNVLSNSNSNLVSQRVISWTNESLTSEEKTNSLITNGPSSKTLENLKCAKVTPILFPET